MPPLLGILGHTPGWVWVLPTRAGMLQHWDIAVSGFGTGYFAGWVVRFALRYRSTPLPAVAQ